MKRFVLVWAGFLLALTFFTSPSTTVAAGYNIDTAASPSPISGLWWNPNESGWGVTLTQQYDIIFVTMYTYDAVGNPIWYAVTNCPVVANGCTGDLYKVKGGTALTSIWKPNLSLTKVGTGTLAFSDSDTGTMNYSIDGITGTRAIIRQVFRLPPPAPLSLPPVIFSDVFQAWSATAGGYRSRSIYPTKISSGIGCGDTQVPDRATLAQSVRNAGGNISTSTPTAWCGQVGTESACAKLFDNVVVSDDRNTGSITVDIHMMGLLANRMTTISYDSNTREAIVATRTLDSSVIGANCNPDQPAQTKQAIDGNWAGYSVKYSPTSMVAALTANSMACSNQTCTILGPSSSTFTLSSPTLWHTAIGAAQLAGASVSSDLNLTSVFLCNVATLDPTRTFDDCTFYSFKRS